LESRRAFPAVFFDIAPVDPQSIAVGGALRFIAAIIAALGPALRAARVDPLGALRLE
jgi:ABC-type lipoprotein release transport system permease subunit